MGEDFWIGVAVGLVFGSILMAIILGTVLVAEDKINR